jgi:hypothetical protein
VGFGFLTVVGTLKHLFVDLHVLISSSGLYDSVDGDCGRSEAKYETSVVDATIRDSISVISMKGSCITSWYLEYY